MTTSNERDAASKRRSIKAKAMHQDNEISMHNTTEAPSELSLLDKPRLHALAMFSKSMNELRMVNLEYIVGLEKTIKTCQEYRAVGKQAKRMLRRAKVMKFINRLVMK